MLLIDASQWPTIQTMLSSINNNLPPIKRFVEAFAYLTGIVLIIRSLYVLKEYGELRTMMSSQTDLRRPIVLMVTGAALLYLPTIYHISLQSVFANPNANPLSYGTGNFNSWYGAVGVVTKIVELFGLIAFVRGWMIATGLGTQQAQPGTFSKAMLHILGGILAMNIVGTANVITSTLGFTN